MIIRIKIFCHLLLYLCALFPLLLKHNNCGSHSKVEYFILVCSFRTFIVSSCVPPLFLVLWQLRTGQQKDVKENFYSVTATWEQRTKVRDEKDLAKDISSDLLTHSAISSSMIQPTDEVNIIMTNDTIISQYCQSWELRHEFWGIILYLNNNATEKKITLKKFWWHSVFIQHVSSIHTHL